MLHLVSYPCQNSFGKVSICHAILDRSRYFRSKISFSSYKAFELHHISPDKWAFLALYKWYLRLIEIWSERDNKIYPYRLIHMIIIFICMLLCTLRKLCFHLFSHWMVYGRGGSSPFDFKPIGNQFGSKSNGKMSPRPYPIQFERKWNTSFISVG